MTEQHTLERSALIVATVTSFMGPFLISAVNVALPAVQQEFSADAVLLSWIATSYLLSVAVLLVPVGKLADIYGHRKLFLYGLVVYAASVLAAIFTPSLEIFIGIRIFQGAGAAMFITTGMAILSSIFPAARRGRAIGIYVAAVYIGLTAGPPIGGILTQQFGWRSIFIFVIPFGAASIYLTLRHLKGEWADAKGEQFDLAGSVLYGIAVCATVYGATCLPDAWAAGLMLFGVATFLWFVHYELRVPFPVFEVRLFQHNRVFAFSSLAALINYAATYAVTFLMSLYLQYVKGLPPQSAGFVLMAQPVIQALFSPTAGRLSDRIEPRLLASGGMALTALGLLHFTFIGPDTRLPLVVMTLMLLGFGFGLFSSPNMNAIMSSVERKYFGIASGSVATMRLLGQMASMALATLVFAVFIGRVEIGPQNLPVFIRCVRICFAVSCLLCLLGIFFSAGRGSLRKSGPPAGKESPEN